MMAEVATVSQGSEVYDTCPDCTADRTWCDVLALTTAGPVTIGRLIQCDGCGDRFVCAYCPGQVEFDGVAIFGHVVDNHGEHARG